MLGGRRIARPEWWDFITRTLPSPAWWPCRLIDTRVWLLLLFVPVTHVLGQYVSYGFGNKGGGGSTITAKSETCVGQVVGAADSVTCTWSSSLPAGRTIACGVINFSGTSTAIILTDSSSDTGTVDGAATLFTATGANEYIGLSHIGKTTGTVTTATANLTASTGNFPTIICNDFSDTGTPSSEGTCTGNVISSPLECSSTLTPSATDYEFAFVRAAPGSTIAATSGFTLVTQSAAIVAEYDVSAAATNFVVTQTGGSNVIEIYGVIFKP